MSTHADMRIVLDGDCDRGFEEVRDAFSAMALGASGSESAAV